MVLVRSVKPQTRSLLLNVQKACSFAVHGKLNADQHHHPSVVCSKTVLNSTPYRDSTCTFITFPHSIFGEGQGSVLGPFKFQGMFAEHLECAISGYTSSPSGGKPHCWFTDKSVSGMRALRNTFLVWEHCEVCAFLTPPCLLYSRYSPKCNEAENPW